MIFDLINDPIGGLLDMLLMLPGLILGMTLHEWGHAFAADRMGDAGPRAAGRLSLNPLKHIDWTGLVLFLILGFGWAKPVQTNALFYRNRKMGRIFVALAGVAMNLALCLLFPLLYAWGLVLRGIPDWLMEMFLIGMHVNAVLFALNLLPIPPLDGSRILMALFPGRLDVWLNIERYGMMILIVLSMTGILSAYINFVSGYLVSGALALLVLII